MRTEAISHFGKTRLLLFFSLREDRFTKIYKE